MVRSDSPGACCPPPRGGGFFIPAPTFFSAVFQWVWGGFWKFGGLHKTGGGVLGEMAVDKDELKCYNMTV